MPFLYSRSVRVSPDAAREISDDSDVGIKTQNVETKTRDSLINILLLDVFTFIMREIRRVNNSACE